MKRRFFLKTSGMAAAATAIAPSDLLASNLPKVKPFTIILGCGFSGLGAAKKLKEAGYEFMILEARSRTGGRIFTYANQEWGGLTCELGAEWIGKSHTELQKLNKDSGLEMLDHTFETRLIMDDKFSEVNDWDFDETISGYNTAIEKFKVEDEKKLKYLDNMDYWRYLKKLGLSDKNIEIKELIDSTDFGETIRQVSAFEAMSEYAFSSEKNEMDYWTKGGNSGMISALVDGIGKDKIKLSHAVKTVKRNKKKIQVICDNGATFECDRVICTLPTYAINKINWEPGFPTNKKDALDALQYCRIVKTSILFSERFWKDESFDMITDTLAQYFFHSTKFQPGTKGILTSYAVGDRAYVLSKMTAEKKIDVICECLRPAFGDVRKYAEKIISYYWGSDQHTMGAYALYDTGQWFTHRDALAEKSNGIYFAGEHIAEWQGFMEGAFVSGQEAAVQVMKS